MFYFSMFLNIFLTSCPILLVFLQGMLIEFPCSKALAFTGGSFLSAQLLLSGDQIKKKNLKNLNFLQTIGFCKDWPTETNRKRGKINDSQVDWTLADLELLRPVDDEGLPSVSQTAS
jgi:hypothetical protein